MFQSYGGIRGAVSFSLAILLAEEHFPLKKMFVTTTIVVVMFTVFFQVSEYGVLKDETHNSHFEDSFLTSRQK